jgi:hypothetical protein
LAFQLPFRQRLRTFARFLKSPEVVLVTSAVALLFSAWPYLRALVSTPAATLTVGHGRYDATRGELTVDIIISNGGNRDLVLLGINTCEYTDGGRQCLGDRRDHSVTPRLPQLLRPGQTALVNVVDKSVYQEQLVQSPMLVGDERFAFLGLESSTMLPDGQRFVYTFPYAQLYIARTRGGAWFASNGGAFNQMSHEVLRNAHLPAAAQTYGQDERSQNIRKSFEVYQTLSTFDP